MKIKALILFLTILTALPLSAQPPILLSTSEPVVASRGPHHANWQRISQYQTASGKTFWRTNGYIELTTGLNVLSNGEYVLAQEIIQLVN